MYHRIRDTTPTPNNCVRLTPALEGGTKFEGPRTFDTINKAFSARTPVTLSNLPPKIHPKN